MCWRIFGTSSLNSSFVYCLFKMQYSFCENPTQPNKFAEPFVQAIVYSVS